MLRSFLNFFILLAEDKLIEVPSGPIEAGIAEEEAHKRVIDQVIEHTGNGK